MYSYTFFGDCLVVYQSNLTQVESSFRYGNECKRHEEESYLGSKNKCPNCGFVVRLQGDFWWWHQGLKGEYVHQRLRWWPYNPNDEFVKKVLEAIGYELYIEKGATMYFNYRFRSAG